jgi:hypothetical protein
VNIAAGLLVGLGTAGLLSALLAVLTGSLQPWISGVSLAGGALAAALATRSGRGLGLGERPRAWDLAALLALLLVSARQFLWLTFERDGSLMALLTYNYGDLPLHWTYVEFLARGASFWPENPIFTGQRLHYPIGIDLVTALFVQMGVPLRLALAAVGLLCSALLAMALYAWGRGFGVAAFLFSGGLVGTSALIDVFGRDAQSSLDWKNLYLALFIPQRGFLFALPAGLLLLWSFRERLIRDRRGLPVWVEGLLWGSLPLFHAHTFLFVSLVIGAWALARRKVAEAVPSLLIALAPAAWSTLEVTEGLRAGSIAWWKPGWTIEARSPLVFLLVNFGAYLPLAGWALVRSWKRRDIEARLLLVPGLVLFAALFFVMLAPWDWDNTKLMLWCYVLVLPAIDGVLRRLPARPRAAVHIVLFYSGALSLAAACSGRRAVPILELDETAAVCSALSDIAPGERIATAQTFNHPVALCGHAIVAGYSGHLWSHGIDAKAVEERLARLMKGEPGWQESAKVLRARYLYWGPRETLGYAGGAQPWRDVAAPVAEGPWGRLYALER